MFISFEGKDGSGKSTHSEALYGKLFEAGYKVILRHFPMYESTIGGVIGEMLNGDRMMPESFEALQLLYVADQLDFQKELKRYLNEGYIVIADRYDLSTIAYYASKENIPASFAYDYIHKYQKGLKEPDITFILSYDEDINIRRKDINKVCDAIEKNDIVMNSINSVYRSLASYLRVKEDVKREIHLIDGNQAVETNKRLINTIIQQYNRE